MMPAALTSKRCDGLASVDAADASTYGTGVNISTVMPHSGTLQPQRLSASACASSCSALTTG